MQNLYRISNQFLDSGKGHTFRSGNKYQILFIVHGNCLVEVNEQKLCCLSPDMILLKPRQQLYALPEKTGCAVLAVSFSADTLAYLSDESCDLVSSFQFAPYQITVIQAEMKDALLLRNMAVKLDKIRHENVKLGIELYEKSLFCAFLIQFLHACIYSDQVYQTHQKKVLMIDDVFEYISQHLTEDLSLSTLEKVFFVSGEHISREFKKSAGITLHDYITRSRIDLSKKHLLRGVSVRDVCQICGFCSYNHFFKVFKKECGMTPLAYYQKFRRT